MRTWFTEESIGVDVGRKSLATLSSGEKLEGSVPSITKKLAFTYGVICVETLGPSIHGFKRFFTHLEEHCKDSGAILVKVSRFFPSTRKCSACGTVRGRVPLKIREWTCVACGAKHDRDINAAKNILAEGLRLLPQVQRKSC